MAIKLDEIMMASCSKCRLALNFHHGDYQHFVPEFERLVTQHGKIRVFFDMADFHGWEGAALRDDIKFDVKHFKEIERIAMVEDTAWEKGMSVFCRSFTTAKNHGNVSRPAAVR